MGDRSTGGFGASSRCASGISCTIQAKVLRCPEGSQPMAGHSHQTRGPHCPVKHSSHRPSCSGAPITPPSLSQSRTAGCSSSPSRFFLAFLLLQVSACFVSEAHHFSGSYFILQKPLPSPNTPDSVLLSDFQRALTNTPGLSPEHPGSEGQRMAIR